MATNRYAAWFWGIVDIGSALAIVWFCSGWWKYIVAGILFLMGEASIRTAKFATNREIEELTGFGHLSKETEKRFADRISGQSLYENMEARLFEAINMLDYDKVTRFLQKGVNVNALDEWGHTALFYAIAGGHHALVKELIAYGANTNIKGEKGITLLHLAIITDKIEIVETLIENGADVNALANDNCTPLMMLASTGGQSDIAELLISKGAKVDAVNVNGKTALNIAALYDNKEIVNLLSIKGSDVITQNEHVGILLEEKCPKCGDQLVRKRGSLGIITSCSGYPACDYSDNIDKKESVSHMGNCPVCGAPLGQRSSRQGEYIACSNFPKCRYIEDKKIVDTGIACPKKCGGTILKHETKRGKSFYGCDLYWKCRFLTWDKPLMEPCPKCGRPFILQKSTNKGGEYKYCLDKLCDWRDPQN